MSDNDIDGEALLPLTERATERLILSIGHRTRFIMALEKVKNNGEGYDTVQTIEREDQTAHAASAVEEVLFSYLMESERQTRY